MRTEFSLAKQLLALVLVTLLGVVTACQGAPASTPTPISRMPTPTPTPAPVSRTPTSTPTGIIATPTDGSASKNITISLSAQNLTFDKTTITVPAGANVTVVFNNKEVIPHNLAVYETRAATKVVFQGKVITGPTIIEYNFTAPEKPGTYFFRCDIHPTTMTGSFVVTS